MKLKKAIKIMEHHQKWRKGMTDEIIYNPRLLTKAMDKVTEVSKIVSDL